MGEVMQAAVLESGDLATTGTATAYSVDTRSILATSCTRS